MVTANLSTQIHNNTIRPSICDRSTWVETKEFFDVLLYSLVTITYRLYSYEL